MERHSSSHLDSHPHIFKRGMARLRFQKGKFVLFALCGSCASNGSIRDACRSRTRPPIRSRCDKSISKKTQSPIFFGLSLSLSREKKKMTVSAQPLVEIDFLHTRSEHWIDDEVLQTWNAHPNRHRLEMCTCTRHPWLC